MDDVKFLDVPQSGSIAGTVHSHNRAGQYTRNRRAPTQPIGTGRRAAVRGFFAGASAGYAALTVAQQDAWASFANVHPITDALGQSIKLTGHQMYVRVNSSAMNVGLAATSTPPADVSPSPLAPVVITFGLVAGIAVTWTAGTVGQLVAVAYSQPVSGGRRFMKTFWQPPGANGHAASPGATITLTTALYSAQFGAPVIGQRVFVRATSVGAQGFNGPGIISSCIVTA